MSQFWFSRRNLNRVVSNIMTLFSAIDEDMDEFETALSNITEADFLEKYGMIMINSVTDITENDQTGDTIVQTTSEGTITTTFDSGVSTDTITTVVVPTEGEYKYTRTTVISSTDTGDRITTNYTKSAKAA